MLPSSAAKNWGASRENFSENCTRFNFIKQSKDIASIGNGKSLAEFGILSVDIYVFDIEKNRRVEVYAKTYDINTYFKIIEVAQEHFPDKSKYYFKSNGGKFPKDRNGLCTLEGVQAWQARMGTDSFKKCYLGSDLGYISQYESKEDFAKQVSTALRILRKADDMVDEIKDCLTDLLKV